MNEVNEIQRQFIQLLTLLEEAKLKAGRGEEGRYWAIVLTQLELSFAMFQTNIATVSREFKETDDGK